MFLYELEEQQNQFLYSLSESSYTAIILKIHDTL